jgi:hypothetical protein
MLNELKKSVLSPAAAANEIAAKTSIGDGVKVFAIGFIITIILSTVFSTISSLISGVVALVFGDGGALLGTNLGLIIASLIVMALMFIPFMITGIIGSFISAGVLWVMCKILGGKAAYGTYYGSMQYATLGVGILYSIVSGLLGLLTAVATGFNAGIGALVALVMFLPAGLVGLYGLYVTVVFTREVQKISTIKAVAAILIPMIVFGIVAAILAFIIALVFGVALAGLLGGMKLF